MKIEEFGEFIEVRSKRKKNVKGEENHLQLKLEGKGYFLLFCLVNVNISLKF